MPCYDAIIHAHHCATCAYQDRSSYVLDERFIRLRSVCEWNVCVRVCVCPESAPGELYHSQYFPEQLLTRFDDDLMVTVTVTIRLLGLAMLWLVCGAGARRGA